MATFDWCLKNDHKNCKQEFTRFHVDPRTHKVVWSDEVVRCECPKRGCACYVKKADRIKPTRRK